MKFGQKNSQNLDSTNRKGIKIMRTEFYQE
jgi:hypothetical protein